ncbi:dihydrolipoyl dehydrogenase family protein [Leifsonia shinshuensis]|uniref:Dihydrolipoamide dehydrogenase n=1 Tax=Leifsonia shinshuensis TaxID=150026 RepID=A0A853D4N3_9MICO|nr:NAD(P)/FAD-dependent oxidoreductase [Leifsonia shinshuensis]NYJ25960.1 dihydrolipoamide dehydrogenase [Leifsonia shinshuensis]
MDTRSETREVDLVVIGAGPVGENVADRAVQGGLETVIVERELVGGECSYWACEPSKALLRPAHVLELASATPGVSETIADRLDLEAVLKRRDESTSDWSDASQVRWLETAGIALLRGHGRVTGERTVTVERPDGRTVVLRARHAVAVTTGSTARIPDIPGLAASEPWTNREATAVRTLPRHLAILGGGVVATEMATAYRSLGAEVTVIARGDLLGGMEPFAAEAVREALQHAGATVLLHTDTQSVEHQDDEYVIRTTAGTITADRLLVATGRAPATGDLGLESVGLTPGDWLTTDDTLLVRGTNWLYAVGDVNRRALLTHQGKYQARAAGDAIAARATGTALDEGPWGAHVATADHTAVPQVVFTSPEVAAVGRTADRARAAGLNVRVVDYDLGWVAGAALSRTGYRGRGRMVVDDDRQVIVGATFVGPDVAELVQTATTAIVGEIPLSRLWHAVPAFPTVSEIWLRLLETYGRSESSISTTGASS